jgi:hypothetical protein
MPESVERIERLSQCRIIEHRITKVFECSSYGENYLTDVHINRSRDRRSHAP